PAQQRDRLLESTRIQEQGRDVLEDDPGLREVRDVPYEAPQIQEGATRRSCAGPAPARGTSGAKRSPPGFRAPPLPLSAVRGSASGERAPGSARAATPR